MASARSASLTSNGEEEISIASGKMRERENETRDQARQNK